MEIGALYILIMIGFSVWFTECTTIGRHFITWFCKVYLDVDLDTEEPDTNELYNDLRLEQQEQM